MGIVSGQWLQFPEKEVLFLQFFNFFYENYTFYINKRLRRFDLFYKLKTFTEIPTQYKFRSVIKR